MPELPERLSPKKQQGVPAGAVKPLNGSFRRRGSNPAGSCCCRAGAPEGPLPKKKQSRRSPYNALLGQKSRGLLLPHQSPESFFSEKKRECVAAASESLK